MGDSTTPASATTTAEPKIVFTFEEQIMAYSSLYLMALLCIVWGSLRSLKFVQAQIVKKEPLETSITTREAKRFPITASLVLFTLYLVFKTNEGGSNFLVEKARPYVPEPMMVKIDAAVNHWLPASDSSNSTATANSTTSSLLEKMPVIYKYVQQLKHSHPLVEEASQQVEKAIAYLPELSKKNLIFMLLLILCWEGCTALAIILKPAFSFVLSRLPVGDRWPRRNVPYLLSLKQGKHEMKDGQLEKASKKESDYLIYAEYDTHLAIAFFFCSFVGISHLGRRHWITNDLLGVAFSIYGIENLHLASFKAGTILLSGLFIYDVFWVFATEVMTTVAKGIDAPILLMFPQDLLRNGWLDANKHGMLGLGDIVIPGIFVALLYRFDNYVGSKRTKDSKNRYYCVITVFAYAFGLLITMGVMHYFKAAQPALLYLVPTCLLIPLFTALLRGEVKALWNYSEDHLVDKHDEQQQQEKKAPKQEKEKEQLKEKKNK